MQFVPENKAASNPNHGVANHVRGLLAAQFPKIAFSVVTLQSGYGVKACDNVLCRPLGYV